MKRKLILAAAVCLLLSGCAKQENQAKQGWDFVEIGYNTYADDASALHITDKNAAAGELEELKSKPLNLTDDWTLTDFFSQDVSLKPENAVNWSDDALKDKQYADAQYGDSWYFTLEHPEQYLSLPDDVMPSFIRITYSPKGTIIAPDGEAIIISLSYKNAETDAVTDAFALTWYRGEKAGSQS